MEYFERPLEKWPPLENKLGQPHFLKHILVYDSICGVNEFKKKISLKSFCYEPP